MSIEIDWSTESNHKIIEPNDVRLLYYFISSTSLLLKLSKNYDFQEIFPYYNLRGDSC